MSRERGPLAALGDASLTRSGIGMCSVLQLPVPGAERLCKTLMGKHDLIELHPAELCRPSAVSVVRAGAFINRYPRRLTGVGYP